MLIDARTLEVGLDRPEALAALEFLRRCREEGISPPGVTAYREEESRRLFQDGRAVFLRNWAYVWRLSQREGSAVQGKLGVTLRGEKLKGSFALVQTRKAKEGGKEWLLIKHKDR